MRGNRKTLYASAKPTTELFGLFQYAEKLDVDGLGKAEIYERAERYLVKNKDTIDFRSLSRKRKKPVEYDGDLPSSFKVRINDSELDSEVNDVIKEKYSINRVMTPFKIKITLSAYIDYLEGVASLLDAENSVKSENADSLKVKAISIILKANDEKIIEIIEKLREE